MEYRAGIVGSSILLLLLLCINLVNSVELTFELVDNAKDCFYQEITQNQSATLEFQVITKKLSICTRLAYDFGRVYWKCMKLTYENYRIVNNLVCADKRSVAGPRTPYFIN